MCVLCSLSVHLLVTSQGFTKTAMSIIQKAARDWFSDAKRVGEIRLGSPPSGYQLGATNTESKKIPVFNHCLTVFYARCETLIDM